MGLGTPRRDDPSRATREHGVVSKPVYDTPFLGTYSIGSSRDGIESDHHADGLETDPAIQPSLPAVPCRLKQLAEVRQYLRTRFD
jgi:hypothetical protein